MSYGWIERIEKALYELEDLPLLPFINIEGLKEAVKKKLGADSFELTFKEMLWMSEEEAKRDFSEEVSFAAAPLTGSCHLLFEKESLKRLLTHLFWKREEPLSDSVLEGFFEFTTAKVLSALSPFFQGLAFHMEKIPLKGPTLTVDWKIDIDGLSFFARLAITPDFRKSFVKFKKGAPPIFAKELKTLPVPISVHLGHVLIQRKDFAALKKGDFLLLDRCTYDLEEKKGMSYLVLNGVPLFPAKIKHGRIKILEEFLEESVMKEEEIGKGEPTEKAEVPLSPIEEVPVELKVEAARFMLPIEKLLSLAPGNILELPVTPEEGVHLTLNGKSVARGELVNLGEAIGIRILEIS